MPVGAGSFREGSLPTWAPRFFLSLTRPVRACYRRYAHRPAEQGPVMPLKPLLRKKFPSGIPGSPDRQQSFPAVSR